MFFSLFLLLIQSKLIEEPTEYDISKNITIEDTEFRKIKNNTAIKLNNPSDTSYQFFVKYCHFNQCSGSKEGAAIYAKVTCLATVTYNCLYDCHSNGTNSDGVIYLETNDKTGTSQCFHYITSKSCSAEWNTLLFRSTTTEKVLPIEFQDSNVSMCSSNNDGVIFLTEFWIDVMYCNFVYNTANDGLLVIYGDNFNGEAGDIHHCNFNNNNVKNTGTISHNAPVTTILDYLYFAQNNELYTVERQRGTLQVLLVNPIHFSILPIANITHIPTQSRSPTKYVHTHLPKKNMNPLYIRI